MNLVYNNDKPIGKCESYSIDKVPGTSPFVMLTNYEPLRSELNENQQIVLDWLKEEYFDSYVKSVLSNLYFYVNMTAIGDLENRKIQLMVKAYEELDDKEFIQVLAAFAAWGTKEVAE